MQYFKTTMYSVWAIQGVVARTTSTGIDADASKGETSRGYFNSKLVYCYKLWILIAARYYSCTMELYERER